MPVSIAAAPLPIGDHHLQALLLLVLEPSPKCTPSIACAQAQNYSALLARLIQQQFEIENLSLKGLECERRLRRSSITNSLMTRLCAVAGGGRLEDTLQVCSDFTNKAVYLYSGNRRLIASASPKNLPAMDGPDLEMLLRAAPSVGDERMVTKVLPKVNAVDLRRCYLVVPVKADGGELGWLVIAEYPSNLSRMDRVVASRVVLFLVLELSFRNRLTRSNSGVGAVDFVQEELASTECNSWRVPRIISDTVQDSAGIVAYIVPPTEIPREVGCAEELAAEVGRRLETKVLAESEADGIFLFIVDPARSSTRSVVNQAKSAVEDAIMFQWPGVDVVAGLSSLCQATDLRSGHHEAVEVARCIFAFSDKAGVRVLCVNDLGPARLFLANGNPESIQRFANDTLGSLLDPDAGLGDLLGTVQVFFESGRSIRAAASIMNLHENTVRLRLARVLSITGLDVVHDSNHQLSVQVALAVLRLQGLSTSLKTKESANLIGRRGAPRLRRVI